VADNRVAGTIGTEYARMLHQILPKIEEAIKRGQKTASFTVAAKFRVGPQGAIDVILSQTATIPMDSQRFKLSFNSGQLSLFEGLPSDSATTGS